MKKMTMADIAKEAGVSKTTVSRYYNGGYVKEETRQKIEKVVKAYDYEPNVLAASLKANKTHTVGIVCPTLTSYASSRMMMNIDQYLKKPPRYRSPSGSTPVLFPCSRSYSPVC